MIALPNEGHDRLEHEPSGRVLHRLACRYVEHTVRQAGDFSRSWKANQLDVACRLVAASDDGRIPRVTVTFACPHSVGGTGVVLAYTRDLAEEYGLTARCALRNDLVSVTFEHGQHRSVERAS